MTFLVKKFLKTSFKTKEKLDYGITGDQLDRENYII